MKTTFSRRRFVEIAGVTGLIALAGCAGSSEEEPVAEDAPDEPEEGPPEEANEKEDPEGDVADEEDGEQTVVVAPDGDRRFDPDMLEIEPGTTVEFVWQDDGHNIVVTEQPPDADWEGISELEDSGFTHSHTFEVEGDYEYRCEPHEGAGMEATVIVGDSV